MLKEKPEAHKPISALPNQNLGTNLSRSSHRHAAWTTPYGRVEALFWAVLNGPSTSANDEDTSEATDRTFAARVAIVPNSTRTSLFRVVFDFTPQLDPLAKITYQAMIPNGSAVFDIVASGQVKKLIEALEKGTASLTDRDEQGCSLLSVSCCGTSFEQIGNPEIVCT
jgi:hypothetical protein